MHSRYPYVPITDRPDFCWPEGRRLAVYIGQSLETFRLGEGLRPELRPGGPQPDALNHAWCDHGNRVEAFRMADLFDEHGLPRSVPVNSYLYDDCRNLVDQSVSGERVLWTTAGAIADHFSELLPAL